MTVASAYVVHQIAGRYRLRIPDRRRDAEFFEMLAKRLAEHDKTERITVNSQTAGVLIQHTGLELTELEDYAQQQGLFQLEQGDIPATPAFEMAVSRVQGLNNQLTEFSGHQLDLRSAVFVLLVLLGVRELMRGNLMAPATSLFWYAYNTLQSGPVKPE
jgi:hypothetical protein